MTAPFFYGDSAALASVGVGDLVALSGDEGRHAVTVKRLAAGEALLIGDGAGIVVQGVVDQINGKADLVAKVERIDHFARPTPRVTVVQALIKGDRMERAIESMTEAGVDRIVLWQSARTIVRLDGASAQKLRNKLTTRAQQAAKQARRARIPAVDGVANSVQLADAIDGSRKMLVLHEDAQQALNTVLTPRQAGESPTEHIAIFVGPEGGISDEELIALSEIGATPVRLGPSVMRASTAGTVALGWVMGATGRWTVGD